MYAIMTTSGKRADADQHGERDPTSAQNDSDAASWCRRISTTVLATA